MLHWWPNDARRRIQGPSTAYIYTLADPRTKEIRYVGRAFDIKARLKSHLCWSATNQPVLKEWLDDLRSHGLRPCAKVVLTIRGVNRTVASIAAIAAERTCIRWAAVAVTVEPLLNVIHNPCFGTTRKSRRSHPWRDVPKVKCGQLTLPVSEWAKRLGISRQALHQRIQKYGEKKAIAMGRKKTSQRASDNP